MLRALAEAVTVHDGPWGVLIALIFIAPATVAAIVAARRSGKARRNTEPNGGKSSYDVLHKSQEYAIGLIHGLAGEMRDGFERIEKKADKAVETSHENRERIEKLEHEIAHWHDSDA